MPTLSKTLENLATEKLGVIDARLTSSRRSILAELESKNKPLTVVDFEDLTKSIPQSSLYRNLAVLERAGLVTKIINEHDFAFFELDEHVIGHHHHLRCRKCGSVVDIELNKNIETALENATKLVSKSFKYSNVDHYLDFAGLCEKCSKI